MDEIRQILNFLESQGVIEDADSALKKITDTTGISDGTAAAVQTLQEIIAGMELQGVFTFEARRNGSLLWREETPNLVTNVGLDYALDATLNGATQSTTFYIGLVDGSPTFDQSDTMGSHSEWTENQNYSESNRVEWTNNSVSGQSIDNAGSEAAFSINASTTIAGAFLVDDNTKGGTSGTLFAEGSFSTTRNLENGDTLNVEYTINAS